MTYDDGHKRAYNYPLQEAADEVFEDWPAELVPVHAVLLALGYRDPDVARRLVVCLCRDFEFLVDTNFWLLLTSARFAERTRSHPAWTWVTHQEPLAVDLG